MKIKNFYPVISLLLIIALSGCSEKKDAEKNGASGEVDGRAETVFAVNTTTAVQGQIQDYIPLAGDIISATTVDVFGEIAGRIAAVYVSIGQRVSRGQNIAAIDPSRPGMEFQLSYVPAPISGTIVSQPVRVGTTVSPAVPLTRISGGGGLEIRLNVSERFISKIAMNLPCIITLDAWPGEVFNGRISEISPIVDPVSRTMEVRITVSDPGRRLKQGLFAKVRIITEEKDNIVKLPIGAMVSRFGEQFIYVIDSSDPEVPVARKREIVPGIIIDGVMEIREGLSPDEEVIIRGQSLLEDGSRVNIIERTSPLSAN